MTGDMSFYGQSASLNMIYDTLEHMNVLAIRRFEVLSLLRRLGLSYMIAQPWFHSFGMNWEGLWKGANLSARCDSIARGHFRF